jgi:hypothetical protein
VARRGEGQFVAIECNLRGDPKIGRIVRRLGCSRNEAVGMVAAWREFVLTKGTGAGIVKGYPAEDIADFLDWRGKGRTPRRLISALQDANELASRRGVFRHPFWADTPTGWYASKRAKDRDRKVRGGSAEAPRNGDGDSAPIPSGSGQEVSKSPPGPPDLGGVVGVADAKTGLTEWFLETYPRLKNEGVCRKVLAAMSAAEAEQLRYCLPLQLPRYIAGMTGRGGRGVPFADKYLREGYYLERRPTKKRTPKEGSSNGHKAPQLDQEKAAMVERQEAYWRRRDEVRARLKAAGVSRHELEARVDQELERQDQQQQEGAPS